MRTIITSYVSPDLDGVSSMYAYSEFLNKCSKNAGYYICKIPKKEAQIVSEMFNIKLNISESLISDNDEIVVVDTNIIEELPSDVNIKNVVEIIDHHIESDKIQEYINAKIQIELVGAAATLVAERFYKQNISISRESAILLYYGIISNTVNFKSSVTTGRDVEMAKWLQSQYSDDMKIEIIKEIFSKKSEITSTLREEMEVKFSHKVGQKLMLIGQLEIVDAKGFVDKNIEELNQILGDLKQEQNLDYVFLNCIDIFEGYNILVYIDKESEQLIEETLNIKCEKGIGITDKIYMRKEIIQILKELENKTNTSRNIKNIRLYFILYLLKNQSFLV